MSRSRPHVTFTSTCHFHDYMPLSQKTTCFTKQQQPPGVMITPANDRNLAPVFMISPINHRLGVVMITPVNDRNLASVYMISPISNRLGVMITPVNDHNLASVYMISPISNRLGVRIPPVSDHNAVSAFMISPTAWVSRFHRSAIATWRLFFMISVHDFTKQQPPRSVIRSRGPTHAVISAIGRNWPLVHRKDEPVAPPRSSLLAPAPPNPNGIHWL